MIEGEKIESGVVGTVTVDSVESSGDEVTLTAGSLAFSLDEIVSLRLGKANSALNLKKSRKDTNYNKE